MTTIVKIIETVETGEDSQEDQRLTPIPDLGYIAKCILDTFCENMRALDIEPAIQMAVLENDPAAMTILERELGL